MSADLTTATRSRVVRVPLPPGPLRGEVTGTADPVLGRFNPVAPPLRVTVDASRRERLARAPAATFEGSAGGVHGGYTAMLLDAVMGILVRSLGISAVTAHLVAEVTCGPHRWTSAFNSAAGALPGPSGR